MRPNHGKRLLIFGASGFTGSNLALAAIRQGWETASAGRQVVDWIEGLSTYAADLAVPSSIEAVFAAFRPHAVVNCAAMANIDRVEREQELAWQVNVTGAAAIAECCARDNARCVYLSSDAVFDGCAETYSEDNPTAPLNFYGQTKVASEKQVLAACPDAAVVRVSLILGYPLRSGNSFLAMLKQKLETGEGVFAPQDEIRTPVDIHTLCAVLLELCERPISGILHIGATRAIDRLDLTRRLARELGYSTDSVRAAPSQTDANRAPRHKKGAISINKAQQLLQTPLPDLEDAIRYAVHGKNL